ncbi:YigZ family protein [Halobaculum sp. MBLA0143]|uniref:IMPACT family protein n=1 Tax=Halobaculum sp. MBLA0143 TaxID=3079933 RepID=UPI003524FCE3
MEPYRTVAERATASFEVRGSEFLGHVAPASDPGAAESFVETVRTEYDDATHNVPVYRVPADGESGAEVGDTPTGGGLLREYESDDGEPSGSAGKPALNVLQQRDLRSLVCVVTRYYGGTNLGVGGLARAYSRAVKDAVDAAGVTERRPRERFAVTVAYDDSGTVRGLLEGADAEFEAAYAERVAFDVAAPTETAAGLRDRIRSATSGRAEID